MRQQALLAAAVLFAVACSDDPTGPDNSITAEMRADIAQSSGEVVAQDVEAMSHTEASSSTTLFAFAGDPSAGGCTFSLGTFLCVRSFGALDGEAQLTFRDAQGNAQDDFDATTTASVVIATEVSGDIDRTNFDLSFASEGDFTVTGLAGDETSRTWNGTGTTSVTSSLFGGSRAYTWTATRTATNVVVPTSGTEPRWPTSGTVTSNVEMEVTGGPDDGKTADVTVTVTFNGTATVPLKVGNSNYTLNLATRTVTSAS